MSSISDRFTKFVERGFVPTPESDNDHVLECETTKSENTNSVVNSHDKDKHNNVACAGENRIPSKQNFDYVRKFENDTQTEENRALTLEEGKIKAIRLAGMDPDVDPSDEGIDTDSDAFNDAMRMIEEFRTSFLSPDSTIRQAADASRAFDDNEIRDTSSSHETETLCDPEEFVSGQSSDVQSHDIRESVTPSTQDAKSVSSTSSKKDDPDLISPDTTYTPTSGISPAPPQLLPSPATDETASISPDSAASATAYVELRTSRFKSRLKSAQKPFKQPPPPKFGTGSLCLYSAPRKVQRPCQQCVDLGLECAYRLGERTCVRCTRRLWQHEHVSGSDAHPNALPCLPDKAREEKRKQAEKERWMQWTRRSGMDVRYRLGLSLWPRLPCLHCYQLGLKCHYREDDDGCCTRCERRLKKHAKRSGAAAHVDAEPCVPRAKPCPRERTERENRLLEMNHRFGFARDFFTPTWMQITWEGVLDQVRVKDEVREGDRSEDAKELLVKMKECWEDRTEEIEEGQSVALPMPTSRQDGRERLKPWEQREETREKEMSSRMRMWIAEMGLREKPPPRRTKPEIPRYMQKPEWG